MVLTLKIKKAKAQDAIRWLSKRGWKDSSYVLGRTMMYVIIPLKKEADANLAKKEFNGILEEKNMHKVVKRVTLEDKLKGFLSPEQLEKVNSSFDVLGDIAILDIPDELSRVEKSIAWAVIKTLPNLKTVAKRATITEGEFRIRKIKPLVGVNKSETLHKENGVLIKLDINKVYFSPRLSTERLRIAQLVKPKEKVLVLFAGVGPYSLIINKVQPKVEKIVSVEINEDAVNYLNQNLKLNCNIYKPGKLPPIAQMLEKHEVYCGDARKIIPKLKDRFDRIVMPLPHTAGEFFADAITVAKKGAIIHLYLFSVEEDLLKLEKSLKKFKVKILNKVICGAYAPGVNRYCFDLKVA